MNNEELRDRAYGLSSFYEKTWESKHLRMQLQRLLYYLKTLSVGLARVQTHDLPRASAMLNQLSQAVVQSQRVQTCISQIL